LLRVPPNLNFEIDDAEDEWLYKPDSLDFVHCRYLFHGIRNWPKLLDQAMRYVLVIVTGFCDLLIAWLKDSQAGWLD
jgi:hypothetical protein